MSALTSSGMAVLVRLIRQNDICDVNLWRRACFLLSHRSSFASCLPCLSKSGIVRPHDRLSTIGYLQLTEDSADVVAHRFGAERQLLRDRIIVQPFGHQAQHVAFALGQLGKHWNGLGRRGTEKGHHPRGDCRAEDGIATPHRQNDTGDVVVHSFST